MNEKAMRPGDTAKYFNEEYIVLKNEIVIGKNKRKALITINLISFALIIITWIIYVTALGVLGIHGQKLTIGFPSLILYIACFIVFYVLFIIAHEYVHYLTYRIFGKVKKENLKFGIVIKSGMAYCISLQPNTVKISRLSLMMPLYILVIPALILAVIFQYGFAAFMCALFASGSAGDLWYVWTLRKYPKEKYIIESLPSDLGYEIGYVVMDLKK